MQSGRRRSVSRSASRSASRSPQWAKEASTAPATAVAQFLLAADRDPGSIMATQPGPDDSRQDNGDSRKQCHTLGSHDGSRPGPHACTVASGMRRRLSRWMRRRPLPPATRSQAMQPFTARPGPATPGRQSRAGDAQAAHDAQAACCCTARRCPQRRPLRASGSPRSSDRATRQQTTISSRLLPLPIASSEPRAVALASARC